jgi:hypothetical protein
VSLSCSCYTGGDIEWWWYNPDDYSTLDTSRRKRCKSCGVLIDIGATVAKFRRTRYPRNDVEERIYGEAEEIPQAPWYHCEACADQFFNLSELGFCVDPTDNMRELVREYAAMAAEARK